MSRKTSASDFAAGTEHLFGRLFNTLRAGGKLLIALALMWACLTCYRIYNATPPGDGRAAATWAWASFKKEVLPQSTLDYTLDGQRFTAPAEAFAADPYFISRKDAVVEIMQTAALEAALLTFILGIPGYFLLRDLGAARRYDRLLRGGRRVSSKELAKLIRKYIGASDLQVGHVPLIRGSEVQHIVIIGGPGTGKSQLLRQLLIAIERRGETVVIYDPKGDLARRFYRAERGDVILDVLDKRAPAWTPWDEVQSSEDALRVATALIPGSDKDYWCVAARLVVAGVLVCMPPERRTNGELVRFLQAGTTEQLKTMLKGHPAARVFANDDGGRTRESIMLTLQPHLQGLQYLDAKAQPGAFSIRALIEKVAASSGKQTPWIFVTTRPQHSDVLRGLCCAWIESAAAALYSLGSGRRRRVHYMLDEFPTLPRLDSIQKLMALGRGYGACVTLAVQDISQIRSTYGPEKTETISAQTATKVFFRLNDSTSAEWGSRELGSAEMDEHLETQTVGGHKVAGGQFSTHRVERRVVTPTEISALPDMHAFLKLQGLPVARVQLQLDQEPDRADDFTARDPGLRVETALRPPRPAAADLLEDAEPGPL